MFVAYKVGLCKSQRGGQKCTREPSVCTFCHSNEDSRHPRFRHRKAAAQHGQNTQIKGSQQKPYNANVSSGHNSTAAAGEPPRPPSMSATTGYDDTPLPALKPNTTSATSTSHPTKQKGSSGPGGAGIKTTSGGATGTVKILQREDVSDDGWTQKQNGKVIQKSDDTRQGGGKMGGENDFGSVGKDATTTGSRVHSRDSKSKTINTNSNSNPANRHQGFFAHLDEEDEGSADDDDGFTTVEGRLNKNGKTKTGTTTTTTSKQGKKLDVSTGTGTATGKQPVIATSQPPLPKTSSLSQSNDAGDESTFTTKTAAGATVPVEYLCPLSKQLMNEPVICADGETYEKTVIEQWMANHNKMKKKLISPVTGEEMLHPHLTPNFSIKTLITAFRDST